MKRLTILVVALLVGAAAPARAWCEATCLAAAHQESAKPHCPSHERPSDRASMSAADAADCPVLEAARPTQANLHFAPAPIVASTRATAIRHPHSTAPRHPDTQAARHLRNIPLRV